MSKQSLTLNATTAKLRLDKFLLAHLPGYSRAQIQRFIRDGYALVDGAPQKTGYKFKGGEVVTLLLPETASHRQSSRKTSRWKSCTKTRSLAVLDKPAGLVVHPGPGHETGTLVNALLGRYPELAKMLDDAEAGERLGIVHRLDRGTSGLLVVARDKATLLALMGQFQARTVDKVYLALQEKRPQSNAGLIDAPIARDQRQRKRMAVQRGGKNAQTEFEVLDDHFQGDRALWCG